QHGAALLVDEERVASREAGAPGIVERRLVIGGDRVERAVGHLRACTGAAAASSTFTRSRTRQIGRRFISTGPREGGGRQEPPAVGTCLRAVSGAARLWRWRPAAAPAPRRLAAARPEAETAPLVKTCTAPRGCSGARAPCSGR